MVSGEVWDRLAVKAGKMAEVEAEASEIGVGILFDETADGKQGKMTCGVGYQYAGCAGGINNCVTWVMASLVGADFKTWASAEMFLPEKDWFTGRGKTGTARRKQAGAPKGTRFMSKPKLALKQLRHPSGQRRPKSRKCTYNARRFTLAGLAGRSRSAGDRILLTRRVSAGASRSGFSSTTSSKVKDVWRLRLRRELIAGQKHHGPFGRILGRVGSGRVGSGGATV
jgi:hypothetical protein